jgi:hypothetical protein
MGMGTIKVLCGQGRKRLNPDISKCFKIILVMGFSARQTWEYLKILIRFWIAGFL